MDYIQKLNFAAHWFLPQSEAEDVVNDYREMLAGGGEDPEERFGSPVKAVLELADRKKVLYWHVYFLVCVVLLAGPMMYAMHFFLNFKDALLPMLFLTVLLFGNFGLKRPKLSTVPKPVFIIGACLLLALAAQCGGIFFVSRHCDQLTPDQLGPGMGIITFYWNPDCTRIFFFLCALGGIASLVCSRVLDRRWRAVTLLIMTVMLVCSYLLRFLYYATMPISGVGMLALFYGSVMYSLCGAALAVVGLF